MLMTNQIIVFLLTNVLLKFEKKLGKENPIEWVWYDLKYTNFVPKFTPKIKMN